MTQLPKKRYILQLDPALSKGDKGDKGDTGATGAGGSLPINTSDVLHDGTLRNGENLRDLLDELFYDELVVTGFEATAGDTYEIGQNLTSIPVTWAYNKTMPVTGTQSITGNTITPPTLIYSDLSTTLTSSGMTATTVLTLTGNDGTAFGSDKTKQITLGFYYPIYTGQAEDPGAITDSFLYTVLNKSVQATRSTSFSTTAVADEYAWIATPISYGIPSFTVNGFNADFVQIHGTGNAYLHDNEGGADDIPYFVYRSENPEQAQDIVVL
jgi:hypothetical protein